MRRRVASAIRRSWSSRTSTGPSYEKYRCASMGRTALSALAAGLDEGERSPADPFAQQRLDPRTRSLRGRRVDEGKTRAAVQYVVRIAGELVVTGVQHLGLEVRVAWRESRAVSGGCQTCHLGRPTSVGRVQMARDVGGQAEVALEW